MKYFMDIEILYEKFFLFTKYCPISNWNVNAVVIGMNNMKSSTDSDSSNEEYNINDNNIRNNIVNNSRISDSENNSIVISNVMNSSIGENRVNLSNFLNNECVKIYIWCDTDYII